jgi:DNA-binding NtrC family response regulator
MPATVSSPHSETAPLSDHERLKVLVVDDDAETTDWFKWFLEPRGFDVRTASDGRTAELLFSTLRPQIVFLDLMLPDSDGEQVMRQLLDIAPDTQVIIVSGHATVPRTVEAMKASAFHVVAKPFTPSEILAVAERAAAARRAVSHEAGDGTVAQLGRMLSRSSRMTPVFELVEAAAPTDVSVLILGENGSGKELVASAIHELSPRRHGTFVRINCAAIPAELLESELTVASWDNKWVNGGPAVV